MPADEQTQRIAYCKEHNLHHLFELLATKVLVDRPENPFVYLRNLLQSVDEAEKKKGTYDPTKIAAAELRSTAGAAGGSGTLKKITLGTFGLNNAGKTTLLSALGNNIDPNVTPTVGFTPIRFQTEDYDICIFDLGGAANFRGIWVHYFHDCHGLIYVVDSAASQELLQESLQVLRDTVQHPYMQGKPLLVLTNKKDLPESRKESVLPDGFVAETLLEGTPFRCVATCGLVVDECLDSAVEWLLAEVSNNYESLQSRVEKDTIHVKEEKERKRMERLAALRGDSV